MERRVLVAIFLCFVVLYLWQAVFVPPVPPPGEEAAPPAATTPEPGPAPDSAPGPPTDVPAAPEPSAEAGKALISETAEREILVETDDVIAVFTNRGARLKSWRLKAFLDADDQPQELVEARAGELGLPLPFTLQTTSEQVNSVVNNALFAASGVPAPGSAPSGPVNLRFEYQDSAGIHAVKEFTLERTSYIVSIRSAVTQDSRRLPAAVVWGPAVGDRLRVSALVQGAQGIFFPAGASGPTRLPADDVASQPAYEGSFRYAGVDDNYFLTAALETGPSTITYRPMTIPPLPDTGEAARELLSYTIDREDETGPLMFFIGPKAIDVLTAIDREFANAIHFGWLAVIVVPLLQSLKWVHGYIGNWGWSIVILTIIINVVMAPLRHKQVVSMRKMQEIQPEIKAIQDRYAKLKVTDPARQKMNQEMMALYREKKVNPAAGCVPILLTLPIMIAMWAVLQVSIELRGAPWFGWIRDLSAPDPWFILPILMVATQFWQQRITTVPGGDPTQQKLMYVMPLVFGFIFFSLPSGALLYYVAGTVIGVGQQYLTNYIIGPPNVRTVRPPAERRVKRKGNGS
jgi:YidC/Oxa1 family membrane protein insertase